MTRTRLTIHLALAAALLAASSASTASAQETQKLTLKDAIERGLASNLRVLAAGTRVGEAAGTRERRLANLLPRVRAEAVASLQNRSLRAFGLSAPGIPPTVPLFSTYDMRFYAEQALLLLARNIGMRPGTPIALAEALRFQPVDAPAIESAVAGSLDVRADYRSLAAQREAFLLQQRAAQARYLPKVSVSGDYGGIGRSFGELRATGTLRGGISVTLFDRDRQGEHIELESRLRRMDHQLADMRPAIEQEVRAAMLDLDSAAEQVTVAAQGRELAGKELELARERFQSGVANNIEIVSAQDALARALERRNLRIPRPQWRG